MIVIKISSLNVNCLSRPSFDENEFLAFLKAESLEWRRTAKSSADELVEAAGRVCYMSFGEGRQSNKTNKEYINHLIQQGHESVFEHLNWTFLISGVSRAFTHQLVRHRVGFAFSQLSQQYHDESEASFIIPPTVKASAEIASHWCNTINSSVKMYKELIQSVSSDSAISPCSKREKIRELRTASRSVLPNATETKIVVTANARALRHFFTVRGALDGDWEMRAVSCALFKIVSDDAPGVFQDFELQGLADKSEKLVKLKMQP